MISKYLKKMICSLLAVIMIVSIVPIRAEAETFPIFEENGIIEIFEYVQTEMDILTVEETEKEYTITFDANGGIGGPLVARTVGTQFTVPEDIPTRENWVFLYWGGNKGIYRPGETYTISVDEELVAYWAPNWTPEIEVGEIYAKPGETVGVPIYIYNAKEPENTTICFNVTSDSFEFVEYEVAEEIPENGYLLTAYFEIPEDTEPGSYTIDFNLSEYKIFDGYYLTDIIEIKNGTITVANDNIFEFVYGKDNWKFNNSNRYFQNTYYITYSDYMNLMSQASIYEKRQIEEWFIVGEVSENLVTTKNWVGSCYGLSSIVAYNKMGLLYPKLFDKNAETLYEVGYPYEDKINIESKINYYHFMQAFDYVLEARDNINTKNENFKDIFFDTLISLASDFANLPIQMDYFWYSESKKTTLGHSVLIIGISEGAAIDGKYYDICFEVYDPNTVAYDVSKNLYYNSLTEEWTIPSQNINQDSTGAYICFIPKEISAEAYDSFTLTTYNISNCTIKSGDREWKLVDGKLEDYSEIFCHTITGAGNDSGILNFVLPEDGDYIIEFDEDFSEEKEVNMRYSDSMIFVNTDSADSVSFGKDSSVAFDAVNGYYSVDIITEEEAIPWEKVSVCGKGSNIEVGIEENGLYISGENLDGVLLEIESEEVIKLDDYANSILIVEDEENTVVYADKDNDGTFESQIAVSVIRNSKIGDINNDSNVDVRDAHLARLIAAKLIAPEETQLVVGDVDLDGRITAIDANLIRKYCAYIIEELPIN